MRGEYLLAVKALSSVEEEEDECVSWPMLCVNNSYLTLTLFKSRDYI